MAAIPLYQLGRHLASVVLVAQSVGTAGALADTTLTATLTAVMENYSESIAASLEEINALNTTRENNVITSDGFTLNLGILKVNNSADPSPLNNLVRNADYFKATVTQGTGGSARTETFYAVRENYEEGFTGRGRQIASLSLRSVDAGTSWTSRT